MAYAQIAQYIIEVENPECLMWFVNISFLLL